MHRTSPIRPAAPNSAPAARRAFTFVWLAAAFASLACSASAPSDGRPVTRQVVGPMGGTAGTSNGRIKVLIPAGALKTNVDITIQQIDAPGPGAIGPVFEVGPTGTQFAMPVTLAIKFTSADLDGRSPSSLHVATFSRGSWVPVVSSVNLAASVINGQITHLSPWTLIFFDDVVPPEPDAGAAGSGGEDDGGAGASGQSGSDGGGDAAADAGAGSDASGGKGGSGGAGNGGTDGGAGGGAGAGGKDGGGAAGSGGAGAGGAGSGGADAGSAGTGGAAGAGGQAGTGEADSGAAGAGDVDAAADAEDDGSDAGADPDADPDVPSES